MLIVRVASAVVPLLIVRVRPVEYVNEHTGAIATRGVIEPHDSVIPPFGVVYPLAGFTLTTPCAPLPAGTLAGETAL